MALRRFSRQVWSEANRQMWDYRHSQLKFSRNADDYELVRQIGRGRYSIVYDGINICTHEAVVVKALNHDQSERIAREVMVLNVLKGTSGQVAQIKAAVVEPATPLYALVFEKFGKENLFRFQSYEYTIADVKVLTRDILLGLKAAHDRSIIHRDIKHTNIIFEAKTHRARIIDWGQAEFCLPGHPLTLRISTRHFKPPEVLLGWPYYDFAVDMWGAGHVLACLLFRVPHIFQASDEDTLLEEMAAELGSIHMMDFCKQNLIGLTPRATLAFTRYSTVRPALSRRFTAKSAHLYDSQALNLLEQLLYLDPRLRLSVDAALAHPFVAA